MQAKLKIKTLCSSLGISQKDLSELSGVRQSAISEMSRNMRTTVNLEAISKIAEALNIKDIRELIDLEE